MPRLKILFALSLSLFAMGCSSSSPPPAVPSPALTAAVEKLDQKLDHPLPPGALSLCQDGSAPQLMAGRYECPPPPLVAHSLAADSLQDQVATLIGALRKEVDLRFQLLHWDAAPSPEAAEPSN